MDNKITQKDALSLSGQVIAGIFANPVNGNLAQDSYGRQQIIQQIIQEVGATLNVLGFFYEDEPI